MKRATLWLTAIVLFGTTQSIFAQDDAGRYPVPAAAGSTVKVKPAQTLPEPSVPAPQIAQPAMQTHVPLSMGSLSPTPDMWYYEQMRQDYNNPELQVRRHSEQVAAERRARIAAQEWYGMPASRPMAYTTPHMYHYSPTFATNGRYPYYWGNRGGTPIVVEARRPYAGVSGFGAW